MSGRILILLMGAAAFVAMLVWAVGALRNLRRGGSGLPYLAMPNPLPGAIRQSPVVCLGHTDLDQPPVTGNGGLWMNETMLMFHSAAGTIAMARPLRFAESTTAVPELGASSPEPMLKVGFRSAAGIDAVAAFQTPDATGWAISLRS